MRIGPVQQFNFKDKRNSVSVVSSPLNSTAFTSKAAYSLLEQSVVDAKSALSAEISELFKQDRMLIDRNYLGQVDDKNKFSKYGYYILNGTSGENLNLRQQNKNYRKFYNYNIRSLYDVASGKKEYSEISLKNNSSMGTLFEYFNLPYGDINALNLAIRDEFSQNGNIDKLTKYTILKNYQPEYKFIPVAGINVSDNVWAKNPTHLTKDEIKSVFTVVNDYLNNASKNDFNIMYQNLDKLADSIALNKHEDMLSSYKSVVDIIRPFYKENYQSDSDKLKIIDEFKNSSKYKVFNKNYNLDLLFDTDVLSNDEKIFLISKNTQAYSLDLYKFLVDNPTSNKTRKQIINNLMLAEQADKEAFRIMKNLFIKSVNKGDMSAFEDKLLDSVIIQTKQSDKLNLMSKEDKVHYLQKFPDEELNVLLENLEDSWLLNRAKEAFEIEADKYDINNRFDKLTDDITVQLDGMKINLTETITQLVDGLSTKVDENVSLLGTLIVQHDKNMKRSFMNQNKQLEQITKVLYSNSEESKALQKQISLVLDKIEAYNPEKRAQVSETRQLLRIGSGLAMLGISIARICMSGGTDVMAYFGLVSGLRSLI